MNVFSYRPSGLTTFFNVFSCGNIEMFDKNSGQVQAFENDLGEGLEIVGSHYLN